MKGDFGPKTKRRAIKVTGRPKRVQKKLIFPGRQTWYPAPARGKPPSFPKLEPNTRAQRAPREPRLPSGKTANAFRNPSVPSRFGPPSVPWALRFVAPARLFHRVSDRGILKGPPKTRIPSGEALPPAPPPTYSIVFRGAVRTVVFVPFRLFGAHRAGRPHDVGGGASRLI